MERLILPRALQGHVAAPLSKSFAHRALICAALCSEPTHLCFLPDSQDLAATMDGLAALGAVFTRQENGLIVQPIEEAPAAPWLNCRESGSTLRFLLPVAAALTDRAHFTGEGRLPQRPFTPLLDALADHGVSFSGRALPLQVSRWEKGGDFLLPGHISSQFASGLLLAGPLLSEGLQVRFSTPPESLPYIELTCQVMSRFGVTVERIAEGYRLPPGQRYRSPGQLAPEGDWSNAAFWLAAGAFSPKGVAVSGLDPDALQGDRAILPLLERFGAALTWGNGLLRAKGAGPLFPLVADVAQTPDLAPLLAVLGAGAEGITRLCRIQRLRLKESDRLAATVGLLRDLGGEAWTQGDDLFIRGTGRLLGGRVQPCRDHRLVMAAAVASCFCQSPVQLPDSEAVDKSYPDFWHDFQRMGGNAHVL